MERSIVSWRFFVESNHMNGNLTDIEYNVLLSMQDTLLETNNIDIDLLIYIRATPETCHERMIKRDRSEESDVLPDYLVQLHNEHEKELRDKSITQDNVLYLNRKNDKPTLVSIYIVFCF